MTTFRTFSSYADVSQSTKQENVEAETVSEAEVNCGDVKDASEDAMASLSPTYMSDAGDTFGSSSYQPLSQVRDNRRPKKEL